MLVLKETREGERRWHLDGDGTWIGTVRRPGDYPGRPLDYRLTGHQLLWGGKGSMWSGDIPMIALLYEAIIAQQIGEPDADI
jgi:hypothetical protein